MKKKDLDMKTVQLGKKRVFEILRSNKIIKHLNKAYERVLPKGPGKANKFGLRPTK